VKKRINADVVKFLEEKNDPQSVGNKLGLPLVGPEIRRRPRF
jgi:hypothetical protein